MVTKRNWDRFCFSKSCFNIALHKTCLDQMQYSFLIFLARNGTGFSMPWSTNHIKHERASPTAQRLRKDWNCRQTQSSPRIVDKYLKAETVAKTAHLHCQVFLENLTSFHFLLMFPYRYGYLGCFFFRQYTTSSNLMISLETFVFLKCSFSQFSPVEL